MAQDFWLEQEPPLHRAARLGDLETIAQLVRTRADINATFDIRPEPSRIHMIVTPLMMAAGSADGANVETVKKLLELGADPYVVNGGMSAAAYAFLGLEQDGFHGGDAARARYLVEVGSPLPLEPTERNSLLCASLGSGDPERLQILLNLGFNPNGYGNQEDTTLRHRDRVEPFGIPSNLKAIVPTEPVVTSAEDASTSTIGTWAGRDRTTFAAPDEFEIPLMCAAASGSAECVRILLAAGAYAFARSNDHRTALFSAANREVVEVLFAAGLSMEDSDASGWSPLISAIFDGADGFSRVKALVEAGADVNGTRDHGFTVFMSAVGSWRYPELLRYLVEHGANPYAVTEYGYNAFHAAIDVDFQANLEESVRDTLSYLHLLGVDIEHRNNRNQTSLAYAIWHGTGIEVQVLCDLGANPNAVCSMQQCSGSRCEEMNLALIFHAAIGAVAASDSKVESLLRAGANPLTKNAEGFTPLSMAVAELSDYCLDPQASYQQFFQRLDGLWRTINHYPTSRVDFIDAVTPILKSFVQRFAAEIPIPKRSEFDGVIRAQTLGAIVALCAYEKWARLNH